MTGSHDSLEIKGDFIHQVLSFKNRESCPILECVCMCECAGVFMYMCVCVGLCVHTYVCMPLCLHHMCVCVGFMCVVGGNGVSSKVGGAGGHVVRYQGRVQRAWLKQKLVIDEANGPGHRQ